MQFHIDSAFLTDIARSWFWNEKMPYKKSEELLMCCLNTDKLSLEEKKAICKDVIEGRKKFVGIDECQIVDDGKNVRTIDEELKNHTRYNAIAAIKTDIACNPFKYLRIAKTAVRRSLLQAFAMIIPTANGLFSTSKI